jgi:hypothetical protein
VNARNGNHSSWVPFSGGISASKFSSFLSPRQPLTFAIFVNRHVAGGATLPWAITSLDVRLSVPACANLILPQSGNLFILHHAFGLSYRSHLDVFCATSAQPKIPLSFA